MSKNEKPITVLVTGVGGGGHGRQVMKALKMASTNYRIIAADMSSASYGLFDADISYVIPPASHQDYIKTLINICKKESAKVVITGSEPELLEVAKNKSFLAAHGIIALVNPLEVVQICTDKFRCFEFLSDKGIKCPRFMLIERKEDVDKIDFYPLVIKPSIGSGGSNFVFLALDRNEAKFFVNYLKKQGYIPLLQEYVGSYEEEYTVGVLRLDRGRIVGSIALKRIITSGLSSRFKMRGDNAEQYIISSGISQGIFDDYPQVRKAAESIANVLGSVGSINIQCRNTEDGVLPFEINPRFSGTTSLRSLVGFNEPDILIRYYLFNEIPDKIEYKNGYVIRELAEKYVTFDMVDEITKS